MKKKAQEKKFFSSFFQPPRDVKQQLTGGAHLTHAIFLYIYFDNNIPILIFSSSFSVCVYIFLRYI